MITFNLDRDVVILFLGIALTYMLYRIWKYHIFPKIVDIKTKEVEVNPKWIMKELHTKYYGFYDIDFITTEGVFADRPRFRSNRKDDTRLQFLIPNDTSIRDLEELGRLALIGKLKIKYGVFYPDKPIMWLSIVCFLLDGHDINLKSVSFDKAKEDS